MSATWQPYIELLMQVRGMTSCAIFGLDGTCFAKSEK
jgi:hypothetical protein